MQIIRGVGEIHAEDAQRLLFLHVLLIEQADVDDDLRGVGPRRALEANPQPAMRVVLAGVALGRDRVRENEEARLVATLGVKPLVEQAELVIQHREDALAAHVTVAGTVDGVAEGHVVGAYRLGNGARGATDAEKPARHLLARADFSEGAVDGRVEIHLQRFLMRIEDFAFHKRVCGRPRRLIAKGGPFAAV